jgi:hypothetical protein
MAKKVFVVYIFLFGFFAGTCTGVAPGQTPDIDVSVPTAQFLNQPTPANTPTSLRPTQEAPALARTKYTLDVTLEYEQHRILVNEEIQYVHQAAEPIEGLSLVVEPARYENVFELESLAWGDGSSIAGFELNAGVIAVPLPEALGPDGQIDVLLSYRLTLPQDSGPFGYSERQANFANWYAFVPPYVEGSGWLVHEPALVGEHLVFDPADFEVYIRTENLELVIAAPAPAEPMDSGVRFVLEAARGFAWSASPEFEVHEAQFGGIPVRVYAFGEHQESASALLQTCLDALAAFTDLFGPYPYESLAVVEMDFADGSESDGLFFMGRDFFEEYSGDAQNYLTTLSAHEISHQWWYALAGNDSAQEPWLDEALATYSEMLFYENAYPDLVDWWWNFRITRFNPSGFVDSSIRDYEEFAPYVQAVYFRGALFLRDLRALMGDEAFFAFLGDYAAEGTGGRMDSQGFFRLVGQHTDADLAPLLGEYFSAAGQ